MDLEAFSNSIGTLTVADIRSISAHEVAVRDSIADEIEVTRAMLNVERVLRATRRRKEAAMAGLNVVALVQAAAVREGVELPDDDVTRVARAAELVVRGIVCGDQAESEVRVLAAAFDTRAFA